MPIIDFPPIESCDENGLLAIGGDFHPQSLLLAYSRGIFPWPIEEQLPIAWFSPDPRGVIEIENYHIPKKLKKQLRKSSFKISFNQNFEQVINSCSLAHQQSDSGTWMNEQLIQGYIDFHKQGHAYSVEIKDQDDKLVGGLYGVNIGKFISGESMFHYQDNASKVALLILCENLKRKGIKFLDTQMVTPITKMLGASEVPREFFVSYVSGVFNETKIDFESFETSLDILLASN